MATEKELNDKWIEARLALLERIATDTKDRASAGIIWSWQRLTPGSPLWSNHIEQRDTMTDPAAIENTWAPRDLPILVAAYRSYEAEVNRAPNIGQLEENSSGARPQRAGLRRRP